MSHASHTTYDQSAHMGTSRGQTQIAEPAARTTPLPLMLAYLCRQHVAVFRPLFILIHQL